MVQCGPIFGTVFTFILKFVVSRLQKRNVLVSMKLCGLWRPEGATREALLSEAGFEKVFRTQNWSVGGRCFVDDLVSCWGKRGAYRLLLEPS